VDNPGPSTTAGTTAPRNEIPDPKQLRKTVLASPVGTIAEDYDFFIYGTASALVFHKIFFPEVDPLVGTLAAFSTYAVGFFARALGGIVWGHIGDKIGRKKALVFTLLITSDGHVRHRAGAHLPVHRPVGRGHPRARPADPGLRRRRRAGRRRAADRGGGPAAAPGAVRGLRPDGFARRVPDPDRAVRAADHATLGRAVPRLGLAHRRSC
jgi:hypothetical protein